MESRFSEDKRCYFCNQVKGGIFVSSTPINKKKVYICEPCIEVCMLIILDKRYELKDRVKEAKSGTCQG
jgi:hypothetical protein